MKLSLTDLLVIPAMVLAILVIWTGFGLQQMAIARSKVVTEYRRRASVRRHAAMVKRKLGSKLRPLGMRHVSLEPHGRPQHIEHRRRMKMHADLHHEKVIED